MRRLLCNPKAWRELMKMNLEKLPANMATVFGVATVRRTDSFDFDKCLLFLQCVVPVQHFCTHYILYTFGFLPISDVFFEFFSIHQVG